MVAGLGREVVSTRVPSGPPIAAPYPATPLR
jgi:hypothetical protein